MVKNPPVNAGDVRARDTVSISGSGRYLGVGSSIPFQYSCLENPTCRGAWCVIVHGAAKSQDSATEHLHTYIPIYTYIQYIVNILMQHTLGVVCICGGAGLQEEDHFVLQDKYLRGAITLPSSNAG